MTHAAQNNVEHLGIFWMLRLDQPLPDDPVPRLPVTFHHAGPELAHELANLVGFDDHAPVLQRFSMGKQCYIARVTGKLAAYGWVTFDEERIGELGLRVRLRPGEAYIWDCFTLPAMRGQHLYPALLAYILHALQKAGLQRIWIGMDADNLPSQSGVARAGFRPIIDLVRIPGTPGFWSRPYPDVSAQDIADAQYALFGYHDPAHIIPARNTS